MKWLILILFCSQIAVAKKWTGIVAKENDNSEKWIELTTALRAEHMYFGAEAGAERILEYFVDVKSKEFAYQTIVGLMDFGYPYNLRPAFMSGDLEVTGVENFAQSYNLYKASIDSEKGMPKWADIYFNRIDKEKFSKFLFYKGLSEFNQKKLDEALVFLDKALQNLAGTNQLSLSKKISRTMARIYYEQTKYKESLDIYQNYLLKMNPIENSDWLEMAWNLYRLGRLEEAMGALYNLEIKGADQKIYLEKYIIRALVYREKCATSYTLSLAQSFEKMFGPTIEKIKMGESLKSLPLLRQLVDKGTAYHRYLTTLQEMQAENLRIKELPRDLQKMAQFLYQSEIKNLQKRRLTTEDIALNEAARNLVVMGESLKFLQFDVIREQFNPDKVFAPVEPAPENLVETLADDKFMLHWIQWGDFWRDERMNYRGVLKNWCQ